MTVPGKTVDRTFFFLLLLAVTLAFYGLIADFVMPIFWALILAVLFHPLQHYLLRTIPDRPSTDAFITTLTIVFAVLIPVFLVVLAVAQEAASLVQDIEAGRINPQSGIVWLQDQLPALARLLDRFGLEVSQLQDGLSQAAMASGKWIASNALVIGQNTLTFFLQLFVMLYLLFFFVRDGGIMLQRVRQALPLDETLARHLGGRFATVARATLKGTFLIGAIQGGIGGLAFWALDLRGPVLWGVVMALFSLLPTVGPAIVWIPAAIMLIATGAWLKGVILILIGSVVIGLVDNLLRPVLVGRDAGLPDYIILLATLGGISMFGLSGVLIGPIIAALFFSVWHSFENQRNSPETLPE
ncbi:MAG TPA: AI-2E family transporter [Woeseiaceae bacterium]|nr:AI-2E family transporter [Woeseiaceae bacterium]